MIEDSDDEPLSPPKKLSSVKSKKTTTIISSDEGINSIKYLMLLYAKR